jgi:nucleotide-binding universal stress UspA family protein
MSTWDVRYPAQQILVGTDFSDGAEAALSVAAQYARALRAQIHLLHVSEAAGTDVMRPIAEIKTVVGHDIATTFAGRSGDPAEQILLYAASHSIDLIVMGTHGRTGVSRVLLGSVAERVIRASRRPVLVVPMRRAPGGPRRSDVTVAEDEVELSIPDRPCLVCATATRDLICAPCRARIRGEALERKQRDGRPGRS